MGLGVDGLLRTIAKMTPLGERMGASSPLGLWIRHTCRCAKASTRACRRQWPGAAQACASGPLAWPMGPLP